MKKFIALGVALVALFLSFAPAMVSAEVEESVKVCEDISPDPDPYDQVVM